MIRTCLPRTHEITWLLFAQATWSVSLASSHDQCAFLLMVYGIRQLLLFFSFQKWPTVTNDKTIARLFVRECAAFSSAQVLKFAIQNHHGWFLRNFCFQCTIDCLLGLDESELR